MLLLCFSWEVTVRDSFTPQEVNRIENKAYEVGFSVGAHEERLRILTLLEEWLADDYGDFDKVLTLINGETK